MTKPAATPVRPTQQQKRLKKYLEAARDFYGAASKSKRTQMAYARDWRSFINWAIPNQFEPLPADPETVANYIVWLADHDKKVSTIQRALVAIGEAHRNTGHESPTTRSQVRDAMQGVRRIVGTKRERKDPLLVDDLIALVETQSPDEPLGIRNRALLLVGFAGAFRRSELVGLDVGDIRFLKAGMEIRLRHSKTDQESRGHKIGIPYGKNAETCPVRTLKSWLAVSGIKDGAIFRGCSEKGKLGKRLDGKEVARIVKKCALTCGLDPSSYAGHSLRAGLVTSAAKAGKAEHVIMKQTRHRSVAQLREYIRDAELFEHNAVKDIGL